MRCECAVWGLPCHTNVAAEAVVVEAGTEVVEAGTDVVEAGSDVVAEASSDVAEADTIVEAREDTGLAGLYVLANIP